MHSSVMISTQSSRPGFSPHTLITSLTLPIPPQANLWKFQKVATRSFPFFLLTCVIQIAQTCHFPAQKPQESKFLAWHQTLNILLPYLSLYF